MGHTPLYSSSDGHTGGNKDLKIAIEELLYMYGVTLAIWGDDHVYERSYPIFDGVFDKSTMIDPISTLPAFINPNGTIHLLAGTGGIDLDGWSSSEAPNWSAYREKTHGFVNLEFTQTKCHVKFTRLNDGTIADEFVIIQQTSLLNNTQSLGWGWLLFTIFFTSNVILGSKKTKIFSFVKQKISIMQLGLIISYFYKR